MGTTLMLVVGLLTAVEFLYIIYSADEHWFHVCLGYKMYLDAAFGLGTTVYFALSGTISGIAISAFSGAIFSFSLYAAAKVFGYKKYEKQLDGTRKWVYHKPEWTVDSVTGAITKGVKNTVPKVTAYVEKIQLQLAA